MAGSVLPSTFVVKFQKDNKNKNFDANMFVHRGLHMADVEKLAHALHRLVNGHHARGRGAPEDAHRCGLGGRAGAVIEAQFT
jgi:hypothetical protein